LAEHQSKDAARRRQDDEQHQLSYSPIRHRAFKAARGRLPTRGRLPREENWQPCNLPKYTYESKPCPRDTGQAAKAAKFSPWQPCGWLTKRFDGWIGCDTLTLKHLRL
jgi:hypothetical protein